MAVRGKGTRHYGRRGIFRTHRLLLRTVTRWPDAVGSHGLRHVLEVAFAEILDIGVEIGGELVTNIGRDDDFARARKGKDSCRPADATPVEIVLIDDHVADLDAYPE